MRDITSMKAKFKIVSNSYIYALYFGFNYHSFNHKILSKWKI